ncbi:MAG: TonB family protein [Candidatus Solibacter sp.]|nr:TonB family protein [Candidatus Solibacter sp.]
MSPHVDILDQPERLAPSFFGSLAFHGLLVAAVVGAGWVQSRSTISMGDPNGGRLGAVTVNPVSSIALPSHAGPKNPVATDTESAVPVPVAKAKPAPKVKVPDPKAIAIPSRDAKVRRPSEAAAPVDKWRAQQKDLPNQLYSTAGTRVSTPDFALAGGGGVGVGNNSPFGNQFGAYADLLRNRVAQFWKTTDIRANNAPLVGVTFTLRRDGSVTGIRITQKSGISALDISAQRAIMDAAPFPQLPPQFPKNEAEIEFLFQLKQ